jgi:UDP-N-acetylglucosamine pyrophosphorylase
MDTKEQKKLNELSEALVLNPYDKNVGAELKNILNFDDAHLYYFISLYSKYRLGEYKKLIISDHPNKWGKKEEPELDIVYTTAVAPKEILKELPCTNYSELKDASKEEKKEFKNLSAKTRLWIKKMQAGVGTSIDRKGYLATIRGLSKEDTLTGSKGTDLFIDYKGQRISLAEAQILQAIADAKSGNYKELILHDIVSDQTQEAVEHIWRKQAVVDKSHNYMELMSEMDGISRFKYTVQFHQATVDEGNKLTLDRLSPGGHGFIAVDAFLSAHYKENLPDADGNALISVIGNGEDLGSTPDELIVGWMLKNNIPVLMLTTDKTELDMKGGQIALVKSPDGFVYVTIVEKAQAQAFGELELFEQMGLREGDGKSFFNTNMALINYEVLCPMIEKAISDVGDKAFLKAITPDLIENIKKQKDTDGATRPYIQLEGAMGSSILNLDKFWRQRYKTPLVHILNIDRKDRTKFFSPIKSGFDFFMQFFSDRFSLDEKRIRLEDMRKGHLPLIHLEDPYYTDLQNVLNAFKGLSTIDLNSLFIKGKVLMNNIILKGNIEIINETDAIFDLAKEDLFKDGLIENKKIVIKTKDSIQITKKENSKNGNAKSNGK